MATLLIVVVTILFPFTPLAELLGFQPLPMTILLVIGTIVALYILAAEIAKKSFYKRANFKKGTSWFIYFIHKHILFEITPFINHFQY